MIKRRLRNYWERLQRGRPATLTEALAHTIDDWHAAHPELTVGQIWEACNEVSGTVNRMLRDQPTQLRVVK